MLSALCATRGRPCSCTGPAAAHALPRIPPRHLRLPTSRSLPPTPYSCLPCQHPPPFKHAPSCTGAAAAHVPRIAPRHHQPPTSPSLPSPSQLPPHLHAQGQQHHTLCRASLLATPGYAPAPLFLLDAYIVVMVLYTAAAAGGARAGGEPVPFPLPQASGLAKAIGGIRQARRITPKVRRLRLWNLQCRHVLCLGFGALLLSL